MSKPIQVLIPTFNNMKCILPCVESLAGGTVEYYKINVINNGSKELKNYLVCPDMIHLPKNRGWCGGINEGLEKIKGEDYDYVLLLNDDTHILPNNYDWLSKMKSILDNDPEVGAVGPSSNVVMGYQNMGHSKLPALLETNFLIGFCMLVRRELLEPEGLDESLPGGDDLDLSLRIRKAGKKLVIRRDSFVFHHGMQTGNRVHGGPSIEDGWNSVGMTDKTNIALIRKHGFKNWLATMRNVPVAYDLGKEEYGDDNCLSPIVQGKGLDIGCGASKIAEDAIGIDMIPKGQPVGKFGGENSGMSQGDIVASGDNLHMIDDESCDYVVARHNLEHYANPIKTLKEWHRVLKNKGKVGITTPDDMRLNGMRLDKTHKHSFNRDCIKDLLEATGFKVNELGGTANQWDFYAIATKEAA